MRRASIAIVVRRSDRRGRRSVRDEIFVETHATKFPSPVGAAYSAVAAVCDRRLSLLSAWRKNLKNSLSKTLRGMNVPAPHWQNGFFDPVMRPEESYSEKWLDVAENPVGKNRVARPEGWPFQGGTIVA